MEGNDVCLLNKMLFLMITESFNICGTMPRMSVVLLFSASLRSHDHILRALQFGVDDNEKSSMNAAFCVPPPRPVRPERNAQLHLISDSEVKTTQLWGIELKWMLVLCYTIPLSLSKPLTLSAFLYIKSLPA